MSKIYTFTHRVSENWYRKFITRESLDGLREIFAEEFGETFTNLLDFGADGISPKWHGIKLMGRMKSWNITNFSPAQETFDFGKVEAKYAELKRLAMSSLELKNATTERMDAKRNFLYANPIEWTTIGRRGEDSYLFIPSTYHSFRIGINGDGSIANVVCDTPKYFRSCDIGKIIEELQDFKKKWEEISALYVGKNIYS
jgi:hypothetical protein